MIRERERVDAEVESEKRECVFKRNRFSLKVSSCNDFSV